MWKSSRNVCITYTPLPTPTAPSSPDALPKLNDTVTYQSLKSDKLKTVEGVDTPAANGAWDWRGKGWLMIASSHWEVLGYGGAEEGGEWVVTYFAKTLFTPAGVDFYSRAKEGLSAKTLEGVKRALAAVEDAGIRELAGKLFDVKID